MKHSTTTSVATCLALTIAAALAQADVPTAAAAPARTGSTQYISLPAQPLAQAIQSIAQQTNLNILIDPVLVRGKKSPRLTNVALDEALTRVLAGTGLVTRTIDEKTITVVAEKPAATGTGAVGADGADPFPLRVVQGAGMRPTSNDAPVERPARPSDSNTAAQSAAQAAEGELVVQGVRETGIVNQGVIPREANQAVRYEIIDRAAIERSGASSLQDLLIRQLPQAAALGTDTQRMLQKQANVGGGLTALSETLDLRGFGSNQTLILVNGRRLYGSESSGPDIGRIPLSAVERIEVSPSSGSAIYGANAMAGVVNIVLRKDYAGTGLEMHMGAAQGGAEEVRLALTHGMSFNEDRTSQTVFFEYKKSESLELGERNYQSRVLSLYPPGSPSYLSRAAYFTGARATVVRSPASGSLGIPGNSSAFYAITPAGTNGVGLTPSSFAPTAGQAFIDETNVARRHIVLPSESASIFTTLEHAIRGNRLAAYLEGSYRWTDNSARSYEELAAFFSLSANNPLNPFRNAPGFTGSAISVRVLPLDIPRAENVGEQNTFRVVGGLKGEFEALGNRAFKWAVDVSWDRNETEARNTRYQPFLAIAMGNGLYNPLKDYTVAPALPQSEVDKFLNRVEYNTHPEISATNWRLNGQLFNAWGGPAMMSVGAEYRHEYFYNSSDYTYGAYGDLLAANGINPPSKSADSVTRTTRGSMSGYMEINLPLVGAPNRMPLLYSLDLAAATRYEKYDDFAAANPPMFAVKWGLAPDVALRAQYSEGFQPPTQSQLGSLGSAFSSGFFQFVDPRRPGLPNAPLVEQVAALGNPNLRPETSETLDAGIVLTPRWIPGLTVNVAYFRYDKIDQPSVITLQEAVADETLVTRGANLPSDPVGAPGPIIRVLAPYVNLARQFSDGIDYSVDYEFSAAGGNFRLSAQATNTRSFSRQLTVTSPEVDTVGNLGIYGTGRSVLEWRGKAGVSWERDGWGASWVTRYVDGYVYNDPAAVNFWSVPSNVEHDLQLRYTFTGAGWRMLENARWNIGVMNVFDRAPPFIEDSVNAWYSALNDPRQRFIYVDFRKSF